MLFSVTFSRTGDGPVRVTGVEVLPTWVNLYQEDGRDVFEIVPLDMEKEWSATMDTDNSADGPANAAASYERTMELVREGLAAFTEWSAEAA